MCSVQFSHPWGLCHPAHDEAEVRALATDRTPHHPRVTSRVCEASYDLPGDEESLVRRIRSLRVRITLVKYHWLRVWQHDSTSACSWSTLVSLAASSAVVVASTKESLLAGGNRSTGAATTGSDATAALS